MDNHFKIIVPFYNVEQWIKMTTKSIQLQEYKNFECILVDDVSTDKSVSIIEKEIKGDDRFTIVRNKEKKYVLKNISDAISLSNPSKDDIIVILDGDDWFAGANVLTVLNKVYDKNDCWLTYGSYVEYPSSTRGKFSRKVPQQIVDNNLFRDSPWMTSHLRTWKYGLWKKVDQQISFTEPDVLDADNHFANCWDLAYMFPLLELAGPKIHFISDIMYVYNRQNPLNVDKLDHNLQLTMEQKISSMEKYNPLRKL